MTASTAPEEAKPRDRVQTPAHAIGSPLSSPLTEATANEWSAFVRVMSTAPVVSVNASNAIGAFELTPRRLADLGVVKKDGLAHVRGKSGRMIWIGTFVDPKFGARLMRSLSLQYDLFCKSMSDYASKIAAGEVKQPATVTLSGALSILHRSGPAGLSSPAMFPRTKDLFTRANGIF